MSSTHLLLHAVHLLRGRGVDRQGGPSPSGGCVSTHEPSLAHVSTAQWLATRRPAHRGWCESLRAALLGPSREARRRTSRQTEAQRVLSMNGSHSEGLSPPDSPLWAKKGSGPSCPSEGPGLGCGASGSSSSEGEKRPGERYLQTCLVPVRGEFMLPVMPTTVC